MKFSLRWCTALPCLLLLTACQDDPDTFRLPDSVALEQLLEEHGGKSAFLLPEADDFAAIPQDPKNPITLEKVELGRLLFHETGIGTESLTRGGRTTFSCASCHFAKAGFQAGTFQGVGDGGVGFGLRGERRTPNLDELMDSIDVQPIRTPAALNVAYQEAMLWNGQFGGVGVNEGTESGWTAGTPKETNHLGFEGVETQAIAGLGVHRLTMSPELADELGYRELFDAAFADVPAEERYTKLSTAMAIAAYERTLLANRAPFQQWLRGLEGALRPDELKGALLFFGKAGCVNCHNGPALNSMSFHALGMADLSDCPEPTVRTSPDNVENRGRGGFTGRAEDLYKFKVPQLYSLRSSPFYGHGASFRSVRDVISYKNEAVAENPRVPANTLAPSFQPKGLTEAEIDVLTVFIETALHDGDLQRYEPEALPSGLCFPNHDEASRGDLGCR